MRERIEDARRHDGVPESDAKDATTPAIAPADMRHRYAVDFAIEGDIRFIAHRDMARLFARAATRARLAVAHTRGFNPHPRVSLPFPRPVGQASDVERLLIDLDHPVQPHELCERLQAQMPAGITLHDAHPLAVSDSSPPRWVRYRIQPVPTDPPDLSARIAVLLASEVFEITRTRHKDQRSKVVNIRPFIDTIRVNGRELTLSMVITDTRSATPAEVCGALGMEADAINHLIRRTGIQWQKSQAKRPPPPSNPSGHP
jgi:radical SAM-linked protein